MEDVTATRSRPQYSPPINFASEPRAKIAPWKDAPPDDGNRAPGRPRKFSDVQLIIVIIVFDRGGAGGAGFQIGKDSIRRILNVNVSTVKRHLRRLLGLGWILRKQRRISRRYNSLNVYTLTIFAPQGQYLIQKHNYRRFPRCQRRKTGEVRTLATCTNGAGVD